MSENQTLQKITHWKNSLGLAKEIGNGFHAEYHQEECKNFDYHQEALKRKYLSQIFLGDFPEGNQEGLQTLTFRNPFQEGQQNMKNQERENLTASNFSNILDVSRIPQRMSLHNTKISLKLSQNFEQDQSPINQNSKSYAPVLIVDDTPFNIEIVDLMISQNFGVQCDSAISGEQAIEKVKKRAQRGQDMYKLILMDINMPVMDGCEAVKRLRRSYHQELKNTLIIAYTAIPKEQLGGLNEKKFDGYMSKPSTLQEIKHVLTQAKLLV